MEEQKKKLRKSNRYSLGKQSQLSQAVATVLSENIHGVEEEIVGLRVLGRGLLERQAQAKDSREAARLGDAYARMAYRLAGMIKAEQELGKKGESSEWAEAVLAMMDQHEVEQGRVPVSEGVRAQALGREEDLGEASRRLVEEVGAVRHVLRSTFRLAMEAEDTIEYLRLAESYGGNCMRLLRLLKMEEVDAGKLERYLRELIQSAIEENARILELE
jgi:hypothetical protein